MLSTAAIWFIASVLLIILEVTGIFNFTALLTGLGALTVGVLLEREIIGNDSVNLQIIIFCLLSAIYIFLSWLIFGWPGSRQSTETFHDIVGSRAKIVDGSLYKTKTGKISWSGTHLPARCHNDCLVDVLKEGHFVTIVEVRGNVAIVISEKGDS